MLVCLVPGEGRAGWAGEVREDYVIGYLLEFGLGQEAPTV